MEQRTKALKASSKVISVIMKIGYIAMIAAAGILIASLIFILATGGETSATVGGIHIIAADGTVTTSEVIAVSAVYLVMCGFLFAIFFLAQRMFGEISATGDPFVPKYGRTVRVIGILVAAMTFGVGLAELIASSFAATKGLEAYTDIQGIVFGAIIFCLSYIIDYGCALKRD